MNSAHARVVPALTTCTTVTLTFHWYKLCSLQGCVFSLCSTRHFHKGIFRSIVFLVKTSFACIELHCRNKKNKKKRKSLNSSWQQQASLRGRKAVQTSFSKHPQKVMFVFYFIFLLNIHNSILLCKLNFEEKFCCFFFQLCFYFGGKVLCLKMFITQSGKCWRNAI